MRIAIASGKGGTGKTLLSTHLASWLVERTDQPVTYADADVEEPNGHLFLHPEVDEERRYAEPVPVLVPDTCTGCGECQRICAFNAILAMGTRVLVFPELCHSCGACVTVCPVDALVEKPREMGTITLGHAGRLRTVQGKLDIGEARATPLVDAVIDALPPDGIAVVDAPPGSSCPVMAAVKNADLVVLVTEPTPFGLHDLEMTVGMARELGLPLAAVINRSDLGDAGVRRYLESEGIPLLAELPYDPALARAYAQGRLALDSPHVQRAVEAIYRATTEVVAAREQGGEP